MQTTGVEFWTFTGPDPNDPMAVGAPGGDDGVLLPCSMLAIACEGYEQIMDWDKVPTILTYGAKHNPEPTDRSARLQQVTWGGEFEIIATPDDGSAPITFTIKLEKKTIPYRIEVDANGNGTFDDLEDIKISTFGELWDEPGILIHSGAQTTYTFNFIPDDPAQRPDFACDIRGTQALSCKTVIPWRTYTLTAPADMTGINPSFGLYAYDYANGMGEDSYYLQLTIQ
jgi:hypothetical protein